MARPAPTLSDLSPHAARLAVAAILAAAVIARLVALPFYGVHHADESFQYLEQANRLVFGYGLVPWEYRYGMRSWLVPLLLAGPMKLGAAVDPAGPLPILLARGLAAILAFAAVPAAYAIGARQSRLHGLIAMAVIGLWYESVYFSVHVLTEVLAASAFLSGAALLLRGRGRAAVIAAGALMALTIVLRFHYGPAAGVFVAMTLGRDWRRWGWAALGGVAILAANAAIDLGSGAAPFGWLVENFRQNIVHDRASQFGTDGTFGYLIQLWVQWSVAAIPILLFAYLGARRYPALAAAAIVNLALHMAIGHKEYRFIYLSVEIALILAAIGSVDYARRCLPRIEATRLAAMLVAGWIAVSLLLGFTGRSAPDWRANAGGFELARIAGQDPALCGIATRDMEYWQSGGYAFLHRDVPLYFPIVRRPDGRIDFATESAPAWNYLMAPPTSPVPAGYAKVTCRPTKAGGLCLYRRPGACREDRAAHSVRLQSILDRYDF
jgi:hypothetical protein